MFAVSFVVLRILLPCLWSQETVDVGGSPDGRCAICVNTRGDIGVLYSLEGGYHPVFALKRGGEIGWSKEVIDTAGTTSPGMLDLAFDPGNYPCAVYNRVTSIRYAVCRDSGWESSDAGGEMDGWPSLALDTLGLPHFAHNVRGGFQYAWFAEGVWHSEFPDTTARDLTFFAPDLDIDQAGRVHVVYSLSDWHGSTFGTRYAMRDSQWSIEQVAADITDPSLDLDSSGTPHISGLNPGGLYYLSREGGMWTRELADSLMNSRSVLRLDRWDRPHIFTYGNDGEHETIQCTIRNGTSWRTEVAYVAQGNLYGLGAAIDDAGCPHAVCYDQGTSQILHLFRGPTGVMETGERTRPSPSLRPLSAVTALPARVQLELPRRLCCRVELVDCLGRRCWSSKFAQMGPGRAALTVAPVPRVPVGTYFLLLRAVTSSGHVVVASCRLVVARS